MVFKANNFHCFQTSYTIDWASFQPQLTIEFFSATILVTQSVSSAFSRTLFQSMTLINSSYIEESREFKFGLFGGQRSLPINDEEYPDTILMLNDRSVSLQHLVKRSIYPLVIENFIPIF